MTNALLFGILRTLFVIDPPKDCYLGPGYTGPVAVALCILSGDFLQMGPDPMTDSGDLILLAMFSTDPGRRPDTPVMQSPPG